MKNKIAIIGAGLFGITTYIILKKNNFDCTLFEKNKNFLLGASTNNLNRVHFGYHYPRDDRTAKQSYSGYKTFKKIFRPSILTNFKNYYFISKHSKVSFSKYLNFCKKNNLKYKVVNTKKFLLKNRNIEGGIEVNEPIYDWKKIKKCIKNQLNKIKYNKIKYNEKVIKVNKKNKYEVITDKSRYLYDIIIDASYEGSNSISRKFDKKTKYKYQLVFIFEFITKSFNRLGLAIMDGSFFSFLPNGYKNKHIFYHVKHSILYEKTHYKYPTRWTVNKKVMKKVSNLEKKILKDVKKYFPKLKIKITGEKFISPRVLPINQEKTDRRISSVKEISKNYFKIISAKVDHSVDIAQKIKKIISNLY
tara:strand:- start:170 stop:1252 length:1083 start_codon:yes stop_codon:yes gene_type:complete